MSVYGAAAHTAAIRGGDHADSGPEDDDNERDDECNGDEASDSLTTTIESADTTHSKAFFRLQWPKRWVRTWPETMRAKVRDKGNSEGAGAGAGAGGGNAVDLKSGR